MLFTVQDKSQHEKIWFSNKIKIRLHRVNQLAAKFKCQTVRPSDK